MMNSPASSCLELSSLELWFQSLLLAIQVKNFLSSLIILFTSFKNEFLKENDWNNRYIGTILKINCNAEFIKQVFPTFFIPKSDNISVNWVGFWEHVASFWITLVFLFFEIKLEIELIFLNKILWPAGYFLNWDICSSHLLLLANFTLKSSLQNNIILFLNFVSVISALFKSALMKMRNLFLS